jgi:hypothetical protein
MRARNWAAGRLAVESGGGRGGMSNTGCCCGDGWVGEAVLSTERDTRSVRRGGGDLETRLDWWPGSEGRHGGAALWTGQRQGELAESARWCAAALAGIGAAVVSN